MRPKAGPPATAGSSIDRSSGGLVKPFVPKEPKTNHNDSKSHTVNFASSALKAEKEKEKGRPTILTRTTSEKVTSIFKKPPKDKQKSSAPKGDNGDDLEDSEFALYKDAKDHLRKTPTQASDHGYDHHHGDDDADDDDYSTEKKLAASTGDLPTLKKTKKNKLKHLIKSGSSAGKTEGVKDALDNNNHNNKSHDHLKDSGSDSEGGGNCLGGGGGGGWSHFTEKVKGMTAKKNRIQSSHSEGDLTANLADDKGGATSHADPYTAQTNNTTKPQLGRTTSANMNHHNTTKTASTNYNNNHNDQDQNPFGVSLKKTSDPRKMSIGGDGDHKQDKKEWFTSDPVFIRDNNALPSRNLSGKSPRPMTLALDKPVDYNGDNDDINRLFPTRVLSGGAGSTTRDPRFPPPKSSPIQQPSHHASTNNSNNTFNYQYSLDHTNNNKPHNVVQSSPRPLPQPQPQSHQHTSATFSQSLPSPTSNNHHSNNNNNNYYPNDSGYGTGVGGGGDSSAASAIKDATGALLDKMKAKHEERKRAKTLKKQQRKEAEERLAKAEERLAKADRTLSVSASSPPASLSSSLSSSSGGTAGADGGGGGGGGGEKKKEWFTSDPVFIREENGPPKYVDPSVYQSLGMAPPVRIV